MVSNIQNFPSVEWFQKLAAITVVDENYRRYGRMNALLAFMFVAFFLVLAWQVLYSDEDIN